MTQKAFPPAHYESQSEEEAVAEDEAAAESATDTIMTVPKPLVPAVRELIARHQRKVGGSGSG